MAPVFKDEEEEKKGGDDMEVVERQLQSDEVQLYDFSKKINLKEDTVKDIKAVVVLPSGEQEVIIKGVEVEPPADFLVQARVSLINRLFYDAIQEIQKDKRTVTNQELLV